MSMYHVKVIDADGVFHVYDQRGDSCAAVEDTVYARFAGVKVMSVMRLA